MTQLDELIARVRGARSKLGRARKRHEAMRGDPNHPAWARMLAMKPKMEKMSDDEWLTSCWRWIVPLARESVTAAERAVLRHVIRRRPL
jgi:hypothetical protein